MSSHYTAGGMPLAFTLEDFLVFKFHFGASHRGHVKRSVWNEAFGPKRKN